jgi:predicted  nucleic acid-binding Zn-ribbon protein
MTETSGKENKTVEVSLKQVDDRYSELLNAIKDITKIITDLVKEQKELKKTIELKVKAGRF